MATPKHRGGGNAVGDEDPTRLFNSPISDDELTLGIGELGESRTMAVAPEDNEALLNELLSSPISSPIGDGPLPGAKAGAMRGWAMSVTEALPHPADREQRTVAIAQLDAPTVAFRAQSAPQTEQARTDYQRMLLTQPLTIQPNPAMFPNHAAPQHAPQRAAGMLPQPHSHVPQAHGSGPQLGNTAVMAQPQYPPPQQMQPPPFSRAAPPSSSSHAVSQAPPLSSPHASQSAPIPRIVPGAQKMPPVFIEKKKGRGFSGVLLALVVLGIIGGGGYYGVRTHRITLPAGAFAAQSPAPPTPPAAQPPVAAAALVADDKGAAPVVARPTGVAVDGGPSAIAASPTVATPAVPPSDPQAAAAPATAPVPPVISVPVVAIPTPAAAPARARHREAPKTDSETPAAATPAAAAAADAPIAKADPPKASADPKPAKPKPGKGAKPADAPPASAAEEDEMKKATEALTNSL